ncbi:unnamed protein product [Blepharisma stoltei]|uniref:Uncharacterized protein n=1 Tax=Blepharisma stoltei TaxID=1481888 RepID=A0AAU9KHR2_9CILI|nr:unnamed protein product [Blepharisma stoltei]
MENTFLQQHREKEEFNQFWYSSRTINALVDETEDLHLQGFTKIACLSTPSLYFSLTEKSKENSRLFEIDRSFQRDKGFVFYDFNHSEELDPALEKSFDVVVVDPPFITREVWEKYSRAVKFLLKDGGKIIVSSVDENAPMLDELLKVKRQAFKPSIPHLVYQYSFFTNYNSSRFSQKNSEIPEEEDEDYY